MKNSIRTFKCVGCGKLVTKSCVKTVKFCSPSCYHSNKPNNKIKYGKEIKCIQCGVNFYVPRCRAEKAITCSVKCNNEWQGRNKVSINCKVCNCTFKVSPATVIFDNRKYCSINCRNSDPDFLSMLIKINAEQSRATPNKFEQSAYALLNELKIDFIPQYIINGKFTVDAYVPSKNAVIQFDGDYWHGNPAKYKKLDTRQKRRVNHDISQDAYMKKIGLKVIRFWQSEFANINELKSKLINAL